MRIYWTRRNSTFLKQIGLSQQPKPQPKRNPLQDFKNLRKLESVVELIPEDLIADPSSPNMVSGADIEAWFDMQDAFYTDAYYSFLQTSFLVFLLIGWMVAFHSNAKKFAKSIAEPLQTISADMNNVSRLVFAEEKLLTSKMSEILYIQKR